MPKEVTKGQKPFNFMALKQGGLLLLYTLIACLVCGTATRDLVMKPKQDISARLEANEDIVDCWSSLFELKSCSNEIVIFFINGVADIGPGCCHAITVITHNCWPAMLTSLGFTAEEGNILQGYCDAVAASSPTPDLAPYGDENLIIID